MKTQLRFKEGQDYPEQQNGLPKASSITQNIGI